MARVKGTNVLGAVRLLKANREHSLACLPARLHRYLDERILVSSWYPEEDQLELLRVLATFLPPEPSPWLVMGRMAAAVDLATVYRKQLRPNDPQRSLLAAGALWRNYHDTGEMRAVTDGSHAATIHLRGYEARCREMCLIVAGYMGEVAAQAGGRDVTQTKGDCSLDGAPECVWRVAWR